MGDIKPNELIAWFQYAIDNNYGYIYGTSVVKWTDAKQKQKVQYIESKYGSGWKNSSAAKSDKYYYAALYGAKWIGHYVVDCSGMFVWAYKKFGASIAHGSNSIYRAYCSSKGQLRNGARADGKPLLPGTAVFTGTESEHGHIGLYVGDGYVIEASGTQAGVIKSKITLSKWTYWGELKAVDYTSAGGYTPIPTPTPDPAPAPVDTNAKSAVVIGKRLALREAPSTNANVILRVNTGERVQILDDTEWIKVKYQGKTGYMMAKYLDLNT